MKMLRRVELKTDRLQPDGAVMNRLRETHPKRTGLKTGHYRRAAA